MFFRCEIGLRKKNGCLATKTTMLKMKGFDEDDEDRQIGQLLELQVQKVEV